MTVLGAKAGPDGPHPQDGLGQGSPRGRRAPRDRIATDLVGSNPDGVYSGNC